MTDRELFEQALEALDSDNPDIQLRTALALRERLAQPEMQVIDEMREVPWDKLAQPVQDSTCSEKLRAQGKPYPRTCKKCGLGPCVGTPIKTAQQPVQEPVAVHQFRKPYCSDWYDGRPDHTDGGGPYEERTLYTAPQPRQRQGLTDEEIKQLELSLRQYNSRDTYDLSLKDFARAIESKLREKNT